MANPNYLTRDFFTRPTLQVARDLLGMQLVRRENGQRLAGIITETEAYRGEDDLGCHARAGRTPRTEVMFGPPGHAYIYFTYGMHWLLNFVTEPEGLPAAVLIRSIIPTQGVDIIADRRGKQPKHRWTNGPAKLCQALGITGDLNGSDVCQSGSTISIEHGTPVADSHVTTTPRVGLNTVPEPWKSIPWRYLVTESAQLLEE